MVKIVRKVVSALVAREERDNRRARRGGIFVGVIEMERAHLENISRSLRLR
jgi:hypothetical protein